MTINQIEPVLRKVARLESILEELELQDSYSQSSQLRLPQSLEVSQLTQLASDLNAALREFDSLKLQLLNEQRKSSDLEQLLKRKTSNQELVRQIIACDMPQIPNLQMKTTSNQFTNTQNEQSVIQVQARVIKSRGEDSLKISQLQLRIRQLEEKLESQDRQLKQYSQRVENLTSTVKNNISHLDKSLENAIGVWTQQQSQKAKQHQLLINSQLYKDLKFSEQQLAKKLQSCQEELQVQKKVNEEQKKNFIQKILSLQQDLTKLADSDSDSFQLYLKQRRIREMKQMAKLKQNELRLLARLEGAGRRGWNFSEASEVHQGQQQQILLNFKGQLETMGQLYKKACQI